MNYLNKLEYPRGIRNNNPGNIRFSKEDWLGKVPYAQNRDSYKGVVERKFEQFVEMKYGVRAMMRDIYNDIKNKGLNTLPKLIHEYAPSVENNTAAYIATVAKLSGILVTDVLETTEETLVKLTKAMIIVENGQEYARFVTDSDYSAAVDILGLPLKKKVVPFRCFLLLSA